MSVQPEISTSRLLLRPFVIADAPDVQKLAGHKKIADTTDNIPHPYLDGMAEQWIKTHKPSWQEGTLSTFAIVLRKSSSLIGAISLMGLDGHNGELGYWIGVDHWDKGYCTEACKAVIDFGFKNLSLSRIHARHLSRNPASGKVMLNSGLKHMGTDNIDWRKSGVIESFEFYELKKRH